MRAVIQRVSSASLELEGQVYSSIGKGILALVAIQQDDTEAHARKLLAKLLNYRIFAAEEGRMQHSLVEVRGDLLLVSQFTLAANTQKGSRPSFSSAAAPAVASQLFDYLVAEARELGAQEGIRLASGKFGAMMKITLCNDGPVTFILEV